MSLLDDARRLAEQGPLANDGEYPAWCIHCHVASRPGEAAFVHAPDCPWLSMPKIVAALRLMEATAGAMEALVPAGSPLTPINEALIMYAADLRAALRGEG